MTRLTRRTTLKIAASGAALLALGTACQTDSTAPEEDEVVVAGSDVPDPGEAPFHSDVGKFFLVNTGEPIALYARCTHRSCLIRWESEAGEFHCPCHGSRFGITGNVSEGPAERPLERMAVEQHQDGSLLIRTGERRPGGPQT